MRDKKLFCSKPFEWLNVDFFPERGSTRLCCPEWLPVVTGNLAEQSLDEVWNGEKAQEIRESILDGSFRHCTEHCPWLHSLAGPVQLESEVVEPRLHKIIDDQVTRLDYGPRMLNAGFDQSCNLSCPTCRTRRIVETADADKIIALQDKISDEVLPSVELLYITGSGDAFGSPYFNRWLRHMKRSQLPNAKGIHIHTNALLWTPKMWEKIPVEIRELIKTCELSIDGASKETYEYNRRGGKFETLLENLSFIRELRQNGQLEYIKMSMVVQSNNYREMPLFVDLGRRFMVDRVFFTYVVNWGTFANAAYRTITVHDSKHPEHGELCDLLKHPSLDDPLVELGNLAGLAPHRQSKLSMPTGPVGQLVERLIG